MVVRVSIKFFMNFGIVKMLQINTLWKLLKFYLNQKLLTNVGQNNLIDLTNFCEAPKGQMGPI